MTKQLHWAIGGLALLIVGFVALQLYLYVDIKRFKEEIAGPEPKTETETEQLPEQVQVPEEDNRPPSPDYGGKYEWHGDHWHRVDQPPVQPEPDPKRHTGPLTYHKELLDKHPVEALRQQARELGHWSAEHIPPFPPDDNEAAEFARELYLYRYHKWTGQTDTPDYLKALEAQSVIFHALKDRENNSPWELARYHDLMKLVWPDTTTDPFPHVRHPTTFKEGINPLTARPLLPFELEMSNLKTEEND